MKRLSCLVAVLATGCAFHTIDQQQTRTEKLTNGVVVTYTFRVRVTTQEAWPATQVIKSDRLVNSRHGISVNDNGLYAHVDSTNIASLSEMLRTWAQAALEISGKIP